jgi:RNA polymerase-binding transcription factor DksA
LRNLENKLGLKERSMNSLFTGRRLKHAIAGVTKLVADLRGGERDSTSEPATTGASEHVSRSPTNSTHRVATPPESAAAGEQVVSKASGREPQVSTETKKKPAAKASKTKGKPAVKAATAKKPAQEKPAAKVSKTKGKPAVKAATAKKPAAKKTAAKATEAKGKPAAKKPAAKASKTKGKPLAKKTTTGAKVSVGESMATVGELRVRDGESLWLETELAEVRGVLARELAEMTAELSTIEKDLSGLLTQGVDSAGDDLVDSGTKAVEQEQEIALAHSLQDIREQVNHALLRLDDGSYGICESCGEPIGKMRLQAFPRATLCLSCKQRGERR